jgi:phosphopantothenoylcysteine decarboxylase/phosphopantothenate--cysteine ligase
MTPVSTESSCPDSTGGGLQPYMPLSGKTVLLGVTGGIAAYKAADYSRLIRALGARVVTVMTRNAAKFVTPVTFAALTGERVYTDLFDPNGLEEVPHITLARAADLLLIAPATANFLAKAGSGLADDLLSTLLLAHAGPTIFCPAMNPQMYANPATQANIERLRAFGYGVVEPGSGDTACGEKGTGRLAEWPVVHEALLRALTPQTLAGRVVVVSAGPTREPIDPVRYISNRSSGIMGYAMAQVACRRGATVRLVSGRVSLPPPPGPEVHCVETAGAMADAMGRLSQDADIVIMTAAVADYTPTQKAGQKIKKGIERMDLNLVRTPDILSDLVGRRRDGQVIVGFCAETQDLLGQALKKIRGKGVDLLIANDVSQKDAGFDVPTNRVLIVSRNEEVESVPLLHKEAVAERIWDRIQGLLK